MQMRAGAAAAKTYVGNDLSPTHALAVRDRKAGQMTVASRYAVAVVDLEHAAVAVVKVGVSHDAVGRSQDRLSVMAGDVHAGMECAFTVERIDALAEGSGDRTHHRPQRGSRGRT